jgi:hypothetical protein
MSVVELLPGVRAEDELVYLTHQAARLGRPIEINTQASLK